ncbi:hypothetical protein C1I97_05340 [Streptomyces sp. NTH33]|nr:hypothetical protein C1I97_05340 [Streptomyces sp. NTH33]
MAAWADPRHIGERNVIPAPGRCLGVIKPQPPLSYQNPLWAAAYVVNGGCSDDGFGCFQGRLRPEAAQGCVNLTGLARSRW